LGSYNLDNILNYNVQVNKHKINLTALQSAFYQRNEAYQVAVSNLPYSSDWYALNTGATVGAINSSLVERSICHLCGIVSDAC
jgi:TonB-dependent starch-binding outer membrane protein SusC